MLTGLLLIAFLNVPDTLPSTAAESAVRIKTFQQTYAREARDEQRTRIQPRRKLEREPQQHEMGSEEREAFRAAVERLAGTRSRQADAARR
jgi:hypothetical protein